MNNNNSRIIKNAFFLLTRTVIVAFVSLFTVRELLNILGSENYGLFNLVFGIAFLFTFINGALIVSIQRYLGIKLGQNDEKGVAEVFLTSCVIHMFVGFIIVLIMFLFKNFIIFEILKINNYIEVTNTLYILAMLNTFLICLQSPFIALINIFEKMSFIAYLGVVEVILKLLSVYFLAYFSGSMLVNYGIVFNIITMLILTSYVIYCFSNFKNVFIGLFGKIKSVRENLYSISAFMGWTLIGNFAWMSRVQGVNILLNMFFGLIANAAYAVYNNVFNSINNLLNSVTNAIKPQIFISYSKGDLSRFNSLILYGTKFFTFGILIVIVPVIVFSNNILYFWLKNPPDYSVDFLKLGMVVLLLESMSIFLTIGVQAVGRIKVYQIVLGILLLLNLPIIYILFKLNYSINSYMYVLMINAFVCFLTRLFFLNKYVSFNVQEFLKVILLRVILLFIFTFILDNLFSIFLGNQNNNDLIYFISMPFIMLSNLIVVYLFGIDKKDRLEINQIVKKIVARN